MINASPRRLTVFKSVVELGGFNMAAADLGIAQPSVGAHIKALEVQIGQPLFYRRRGSRPQLTKAGQALYTYTLATLEKAQETSHLLANLRVAEARSITLAIHRDLASRFVSDRIASFAAGHPKLRVITRIGMVEDVLELVRGNSVNVGLFPTDGPISGLRSHRLAHEPWALVAAPFHPLAGRKINPADVTRHGFVTALGGSRFGRMVQKALQRVGVAPIQVAMEAQETQAVKALVRHGAGIACLLRCTVEDEIANGQLVGLQLTPKLAPMEIRCAYREPVNDLTASLIAHLRRPG